MSLTPPTAKTVLKEITHHGETRADHYWWLREKDNPDVRAYLEAENAYTEAVMADSKDLQEGLYQELLGRIKQTDLSVPIRRDHFYYYSRTEEGKQYAIHCRKQGSLEAPEEILLDENSAAADQPYYRLGNFAISPDHRLLAFAVDSDGSESYTLRVKDLATGELLPDSIPGTYYTLEWASDNRTLFYTIFDETTRRPHKIFRHVLGTSPAEDTLVYHETDERFNVAMHKTRSREYLLLSTDSLATSEVHYLRADHPTGEFEVVLPRQHDIEYQLDHLGDQFYVRINDTGRNFRLVRFPVQQRDPDHWVEVLAHRRDASIDDVDCFADFLVVTERVDALHKLRIFDLRADEEHHIAFPEPVYSAGTSGNVEFQTKTLRFVYTSLVTPSSVYDYNMETRERQLLKRQEVLGGYDPQQYESARLHATAPDGTSIPISLVYKKGFPQNGQNPALLYGYGSYGYPMDPTFSSNRLSLLDRGFVYAIGHIRGGSDVGKTWHDAGKLLRKMNTFTDFVACAETLIREGFTSPRRLAIHGGSAGGLLVGATLNLRPELFQAAIADVPFVDVLNTATDPSLPLTIGEYDEWGNSTEPEYFHYIKSYSPYDNVRATAYPHILATAGLNDPRVSYWEPAKWVAKLRTMKTDQNLLLLKTNMDAGHGGASGRYDRLREIAFEYAFLLKTLSP